ncbi:MAG: zinc dependent phospholipase C family protein [Anaerolineae bacterium]|nr:zinc dependent phospholipase C family protein [Anaerolineae bacterium]
MATWIVHLRLAEELLALIDDLDEASFAIGNIAPDSGIPDENWEKFDPPAEVLHFGGKSGKGQPCADLEFYRQHLEPLSQWDENREQFSFLLGYFFHLITDNLWSEEIGKPTRERFAAEAEADPKFVWKVKHDWYGLDFKYVREHPDSLLWRVFLDCQYTGNYLDFLQREAIHQRVEYIKEMYQKTDDETEQWYRDMPGIYLTEKEMDRFIETSTAQLFAIYQHLQRDLDTSGCSTALELDSKDPGGYG